MTREEIIVGSILADQAIPAIFFILKNKGKISCICSYDSFFGDYPFISVLDVMVFKHDKLLTDIFVI